MNTSADNLCVTLQRIRQRAPPTALLVQVFGFCRTRVFALLATSVTVMPVLVTDHVIPQARTTYSCEQTVREQMHVELYIIMQHDHSFAHSPLVTVTCSCLHI